MESLRQRIDPYLTAQPNPDQTFREYIEQLLQQSPSGFTSAFTEQRPKEEATTAQEASPTTTITEGMFRPYLDSGGGGGESDFGVASTSPAMGQGINTNAINAYAAMIDNPNAIATVVNQGLGLLGFANPLAPFTGLLTKGIGELGFAQQRENIAQSFDALNNFSSVPGIVTVSDQHGNVIGISSPQSVAVSDAGMFGAVGTGSGLADVSNVADTGFGVTADGTTVSNDATIAAQDAANFGDVGVSSGGGGGGGGKIICTAMNHAYGFGSFRNAVWITYSEKHMTKAHEVGYHTLFLPLVAAAYKHNKWYSKTIRKVLEHGTRHRTADLRAEMRNTKRDTLGRAYRFVLEPLCYVVGKLKGY